MAPRGYTPPWQSGWRERAWRRAGADWDVVVVGGGITGAGILSVAAHSGARVLLLEQGDFASGTSSRSSKLVHGGLRYLKQSQIGLTRQCVRERQHLLGVAPGLVEALPFLYPVYEHDRVDPWLVGLGLSLYTHLASGTGPYQRIEPDELGSAGQGISGDGLLAAYRYGDACTDDARLVMRVIHDGLVAGGERALAMNYAHVFGFVRSEGRVAGVTVSDRESGAVHEVNARVVINATGVWADTLRELVGAPAQLRPLRGSHLFISSERLPLTEAVAFAHPSNGRPVFAYPWQGLTLVGTTDMDHTQALDREPSISTEEADYLLLAVQETFPRLGLDRCDVVSTQAGVRPVVDTGQEDPSSESREHVLLTESGMLTVTGGKLTTFRPIAVETLRAAHGLDSRVPSPDWDTPVVDRSAVGLGELEPNEHDAVRLLGRYGPAAGQIASRHADRWVRVPGTPYLWAEVLWSIEHEAVIHLSDLLLRRFRCGILLADGGRFLLPEIEGPCRRALGWTNARWVQEVAAFEQELTAAHGRPSGWSEVEG